MHRFVLVATVLAVMAALAAAADTADTGTTTGRRRPSVFGAPLNSGRWRCAREVALAEGQAALCRADDPTRVLVDQVYTINLAKRRDRWTSVVAEMRAHDVRTTRVDAIDGSTLSEFEVELFQSKNLRKMTKGLVGNFISHMRVWQDIANRKWGRALILEDDALFNPTFTELDARLDELTAHDPAWHFLYTGRLSERETWLLLRDEGVVRYYTDKRTDVRVSATLVNPGPSEGMWGYILTAAGARAMIDAYKAAGLLLDVDLVLHLPAIRNRLRMYACDPPISAFNEDDAYSDDSLTNTALNFLKRANKLVAAEMYHDARARYERALVLGLPPAEQCWAHTNIGFINDLTDGQPEVSEMHFETAIALEAPTDQLADAYGNYCYFLYRHGQLTKAKTTCERGLKLMPYHAKCAANLNLVKETLAAHGDGQKNLGHKHIDP